MSFEEFQNQSRLYVIGALDPEEQEEFFSRNQGTAYGNGASTEGSLAGDHIPHSQPPNSRRINSWRKP
jgi:hypothetical protein